MGESYWQADKEKSLSLGVYRDREASIFIFGPAKTFGCGLLLVRRLG
jgi:hypothetical protein